MPNWCHNRVTAYGDEDKIEEVKKIFESKTPFNDIFPQPDWNNTPNENGELPQLEQHKGKMGRLSLKRIISQMAEMMTDGMIGDFKIGIPSGKHQKLNLNVMTRRFSQLHLIPHGVHPKES